APAQWPAAAPGGRGRRRAPTQAGIARLRLSWQLPGAKPCSPGFEQFVEWKADADALPRAGHAIDGRARPPDPIRMTFACGCRHLEFAGRQLAVVATMELACELLLPLAAIDHDAQVTIGRQASGGDVQVVLLPVAQVGVEVIHAHQLLRAAAGVLQIAPTP